MSSSRLLSGSKRGFRSSLQNLYNKTKDLLEPTSKSASQSSLGAPTLSTNPSSLCIEPAPTNNIDDCPPPQDHVSANAPNPALVAEPPSAPTTDDMTADNETCTTRTAQGYLNDEKKIRGWSWTGLEATLGTLHQAAKALPPLQSVVGSLISCLELIQVAAQNHKDYDHLASDLRGVAVILEGHLRKSASTNMSDCVANVVQSLEREIKYINKIKEQDGTRRIDEAHKDAEELVRCYRRVEGLFRLLQVDATLSIWTSTQEQLANTRLEAMSPAKAAHYNSAVPENVVRSECAENTRTNILTGLKSWSDNPATAKVYWLDGMAGTGKTTIACSLSAALADRKQLGASFFCTRVLEECRDVTRIIPTIAYQLARYSLPFQHALCEVLGSDPDITKRNISMQFKRLLMDPLLKVQTAIPDNVVVVIDALNECDAEYSIGTLLDTLFRHAADLPVRFFIASRPEPAIRDRVMSQGENACFILNLHETAPSSIQADIAVYLRKELEFMSPYEDELRQLVQLSGSLFIYAATMVRYIRFRKKSVNPRERLRAALAEQSDSTKMYAELDALYTTILEGALDDDGLEEAEVDRVRLVLWTAICVQEPVSVKTLATLTGLDEENTGSILQSLRSVLHISQAKQLVTALHASFPDYLFSQQRSKHFFCDKGRHSPLVAQRCFEVMKAELRFNICQLESSFLLDRQIKDLEWRVHKYVSRTLSYACQYWGDHLLLSIPTQHLSILLEDFLSNHLLFWMEVLNLSRFRILGVLTLQKTRSWIAQIDNHPSPDLATIASDALEFVAYFASNPVSLATPHIYLSVLPFFHYSSPVFARYRWQMQGLLGVKGTAMQPQGSIALSSWNAHTCVSSVAVSPDGNLIAFGGGDASGGAIGIFSQRNGAFTVYPFAAHNCEVTSVAFSPGGTRIVSGSNDRTICLWNAQGGHIIVGPLKGHAGCIKSVVFSPNGTCIASGSADRSIRVWDAQGGELVAGPFVGHTDCVNSVSFSPDGTCIASGSSDMTICVWNARNGRLVAGPIIGHMGSVNSVVFSLDSTRIASGSSDRTVRVWHAKNGKLVAGPLKGHTHSVNSVAFSPDSMRIASGSSDETVCVWDAQDGNLVAGPFKGHSDYVRSVVFSSAGMCIISGSSDGTVRLWNAKVTKAVNDSFRGHTASINSVAFSPDGTHVVSGSDDKTVCLWDIRDGQLVAGPLKGHTGCIRSVAFSPNGIRVASGSTDRSICVWDTQGGELVAGPFVGHTNSVNSISFSPDGTRIVSGSSDKTICVWNARDGSLAAGPVKGHTNWVRSVAFSPDGTRIVSGSSDKTIRVWSSHDGQLVAGPFEGHTLSVNSVAFSPDSMRIVSGSSDETICVWDAQDGNLIAGPFKGHSDYVQSVAFSPDGLRIVSGSADRTISMWHAEDGRLISGPFMGHTKRVNSVAFSPNGEHIVSSSSDCSICFTSLQGLHSSASAPSRGWTINASGWLVNFSGQNLFWVPPHLRSYLPHVYNSCVIQSEGSLLVDCQNVMLGESWSQCFTHP